MAKGDPDVSPWTYSAEDYQERVLSVTVPYDANGNLQGATVHRDPGCLFSTIVFENPTDQLLRKALPAAPEGDTQLTAQQVRQRTGFRTITDLRAAGQVTAE